MEIKSNIQEQKAPLIIFAYARPDHLEKCLDSVATNKEAIETDLFLFCDGAKNEKVAKRVQEVQKIALQEKERGRFKSVVVECSTKNKGLATSVINGVSEVIQKYGRCIVVEDDLILSKYFLKFMNGALDFYKKDDGIWGVTGYTYPFRSLRDYPHDCYLSYRISSWGWGTWSDRWETVDWEVKDYKELFYKPWRWIRFNRGGNDLFRMLRRQMQGKRDSWAVRFCYAQSRQNKMAIYPSKTLLINQGFDGQGTHCEPDYRFENATIDNQSEVFIFEKLNPDRKVLREFKSLFKVTPQEALDSIKGKLQKLLRKA
ncbi:MAG: sugar transferase [Tyzzerella sp.]|nr:sugar transferase [Tyzzerella sp.]